VKRSPRLEHPPGALDVDRARLVERQVEGDRRGAVDDRPDAAGQRLPALAQPQARRRQVARQRRHAALERTGVAARGRERVPNARRGLRIVAGADEGDHVALGALEVAREQLHADEAGGTGEQDGVVGHGELGARGHGTGTPVGGGWRRIQADDRGAGAQRRRGEG
jgi:hypothetical protein